MSKPRHRLVGRQWAVARITDWYRSGERALVVTGTAGSGKTTLVTSLGTASMPGSLGTAVGAIHRCRSHLLASTDPMRVLAGLAGQLACRDPEYGATLLRLNWTERRAAGRDLAGFARSVVLDSMTPSLAFERALRQPFTSLASDRPQTAGTVVVIDGLDEAPPALARMLSDHLRQPVPGLRLLLSTRTGTALTHLDGLPRLDLAADCPAGVEDLGAYLATVPGLSGADRDTIVGLAGASYPYAQLAAQLVRSGAGAVTRGANDATALIEAVLDAAGDPAGRARQILSVLARSLDTGLSVTQLAWIVGLPPPEVAVQLDRLRHLLTPSQEVRPYHRCLAEHIQARTPDVAGIDWMIAAALWRRWQAHGAGAGRYVMRCLLPHLADAAEAKGTYPAETALLSAATDIEYLTALLDGVGVDDVVSILGYVVDRLTVPPADVCHLSMVFRRQAPVLRATVTRAAVLSQLLYESATLGAMATARRLAAHIPEHAIATLWATADSPLRLTLNPLRGHPSQVVSLAVTADATRAFSASADGTTRVWRLASGLVVHENHSTEQLVGLHATPRTSQVVATTADGCAQVLDADTGDPVGRITGGRVALVTAFAIAADGHLSVSGDVDGNATVWDVNVGEPVLRLTCDLDLITSVALTPDGSRVAVASLSGDVIVWDMVLGKQLPRVRYPGAVNALALTPDGRRVLVCGDELVVHDLTDPAVPEVARLVPNDWVTAVAINPLMPAYVLIGTVFGQVAYLRLPPLADRGELWPTT